MDENYLTSTINSSARFVSRADAARYIAGRYGFPCSRQWLAKLAVAGKGPAFQKAGRFPVYQPAELDRWATHRIAAASRPTTPRTDGRAR